MYGPKDAPRSHESLPRFPSQSSFSSHSSTNSMFSQYNVQFNSAFGATDISIPSLKLVPYDKLFRFREPSTEAQFQEWKYGHVHKAARRQAIGLFLTHLFVLMAAQIFSEDVTQALFHVHLLLWLCMLFCLRDKKTFKYYDHCSYAMATCSALALFLLEYTNRAYIASNSFLLVAMLVSYINYCSLAVNLFSCVLFVVSRSLFVLVYRMDVRIHGVGGQLPLTLCIVAGVMYFYYKAEERTRWMFVREQFQYAQRRIAEMKVATCEMLTANLVDPRSDMENVLEAKPQSRSRVSASSSLPSAVISHIQRRPSVARSSAALQSQGSRTFSNSSMSVLREDRVLIATAMECDSPLAVSEAVPCRMVSNIPEDSMGDIDGLQEPNEPDDTEYAAHVSCAVQLLRCQMSGAVEHSPPPKCRRVLFSMFEKLDVSIDHLTAAAQQKDPLVMMCGYVVAYLGIACELSLNITKMVAFFRAIQDGISTERPFYNMIHTIDNVCGAAWLFKEIPELMDCSSPLERLCVVISVAAGSMRYPGRENDALVLSGDELSMVYTDNSVRQRALASNVFILLKNHWFLPDEIEGRSTLLLARHYLTHFILTTDVLYSSLLVGRLDYLTKSNLFADKSNLRRENVRWVLFQVIMRISDVTFLLRPFETLQYWCKQRQEEMYIQDDVLRVTGIHTRPLEERSDGDGEAKRYFINLLHTNVIPLLEGITSLMQTKNIVPTLYSTLENWDVNLGEKS